MSEPQPHADERPEASDGLGPTESAASIRAALERESANADHLRRLTQHQRAELDRRSVRVVLSIGRRVHRLRSYARTRVEDARDAASVAALSAAALPVRTRLGVRRAQLAEAVAGLAEPPPLGRTCSLVVVADGSVPTVPYSDDEPLDVTLLLLRSGLHPPRGFGGRVVRASHKADATAVNDAVAAAAGELIAIVRSTTEPLEAGWLRRLAAAVGDDVVAAVPMLLHPSRGAWGATPHDLCVRSLGFEVTDDDELPDIKARLAGEEPDPTAPVRPVDAGSASAVLVRRDVYRSLGGLRDMDDLDSAVVELCGRIRASGGQVAGVPGAVLFDERPVASLQALAHPIEPAERSRMALTARRYHPLRVGGDGGRPVSLRIRLTISAPVARTAHRWGDWHLAESFARSLRRQGHAVDIHTLGEVGPQPVDLHIVLRGTAPVPRRGEAKRVLWLISHPEGVTLEECDDADLVLVASENFAESLRHRTSTPVEVFLQATDHHRFQPVRPDNAHAHAVAAVAVNRHGARPSVRYAIDAGLRPAVYGSGWQGVIPSQLIVAEFVPNHHLPVIYSSVGVLLNDHWDTMKAWGFVSNRIFDGLACATPIVSDDLPELHGLFGESLQTFGDADDLAVAVERALEDPVKARRLAEEGRQIVLAHHTFDHRASELLEILQRHELVHPH
jgi:glycosyltransferase involved in cell wall biosynthesis